MKKGRPGHVLHVLTDAMHIDAMRHLIHTTTGTFGVRATAAERWPASRSLDSVTLDGMVVRMKIGYGRAKPEFEDIALIATKTGLAVHEVASRAEEAWRAEVASRAEEAWRAEVASRAEEAGRLSGRAVASEADGAKGAPPA
jgi:uncharacterized protein (DUF111 family)